MTLVRRALRHPLRVRLLRRRLSQGCAILLLLPTAAAFLPVQGRSPQKTMALAPLDPASLHPAPAPPVSRPTLVAAASRHMRPLASLPVLSGLASWYGKVFDGHRTASGERFDPNALTACHRTLPFGTLVRVVNLLNHRTVIVRITDRGVLNANRVIDLSSAAAEQLDMLKAGVAPVRLEIQSLLHGTPDAQPVPAPDALASPEPGSLTPAGAEAAGPARP